MERDGEIDFADVAMAFPLRVIMTMLGVPAEDEPLMMRLTQQTLSSQDPEFQAEGGARKAMLQMYDYFKKIINDLRETPNETLASVVANARIDGELLADRDVFGLFQHHCHGWS
jgi:cytochrome P450